LLLEHGWKRVALFHQAEEDVAAAVRETLKQNDIEIR